jgi:hypothetical protein
MQVLGESLQDSISQPAVMVQDTEALVENATAGCVNVAGCSSVICTADV